MSKVAEKSTDTEFTIPKSKGADVYFLDNGAIAITGATIIALAKSRRKISRGIATGAGIALGITNKTQPSVGTATGSAIVRGGTLEVSSQIAKTSLSLTGVVPVVKTDFILFPSTSAIQIITGIEPVVIYNHKYSPSSDFLTITNGVSLDIANFIANLPVVTLTLQGVAPVTRTNFYLTPSVRPLPLVGLSPILDKGVVTSNGTISTAEVTPILIISTKLIPSAGSLTVAGINVGTLQLILLTVSTGTSLVLSGVAGRILKNFTLTPNIASPLTLTGLAPIPARSSIVTPMVGQLILSGNSVSLYGNSTIHVVVGSLTLTLQGLATFESRTISTSKALVILTEQPISVLLGNAISPAVADPIILTGSSLPIKTGVTPNTGLLNITGINSAITNVAIVVAKQAMFLVSLHPTYLLNAINIIPTTAHLAFSGVNPIISYGAMPSVGSLSLSGEAPILAGVVIVPVGGSLSLIGTVPSLSTNFYLLTQAGSVTLTSSTLTLTSVTVVPTSGTLSLTGNAALEALTLQPSTGSLMLTLVNALVFSYTLPIQVVGPALVLTGYSVSFLYSTGVIPATANLLLASASPVAGLSPVLMPSTGAMAITGIPSIITNVATVTLPGSITIAGTTPLILSGGGAITPKRGGVVFGFLGLFGLSPKIDIGVITQAGSLMLIGANSWMYADLITPTVATLSITGTLPIIINSSVALRQPTEGALTLAGTAPTLV
jgi:hypothetical protein